MAHEWSVLTNSTEQSFTEKLTVTQPDKFPATYGTHRFITVLRKSWAR
jgi:hypothetical protein